MAVYIRLTKFLAGEGRNKKRDPRFSRCGSCPSAQGENDQMDLEMAAGLLESRLSCGGHSSGMADQAYLRLTVLFESSTAASSPSHSFFEADRPDWVYQWKTLTSRREVVDRNTELGTRCSSTAGPSPLSAKFDPKFVSERPGNRAKGKNLLHRRNRSGGRFASSRYRGIRPSIEVWDRTIIWARIFS